MNDPTLKMTLPQLVEESFSLLDTLTRTLDPESKGSMKVDPSELERQKQDLEAKYKTFLNAYKATEPAHPESLRKLEDLKA